MHKPEHFKILIVDDEEPARRRLAELIVGSNMNASISEASDGQSALHQMRSSLLDLVFLDIQMPVMNGIEVVHAMGVSQMPMTVFVTAFDKHAIQAFEANALDYLLKPYSDGRFTEALDRIRNRRHLESMSEFAERLLGALPIQQSAKRYLDKLAVRIEGGTRLIAANQIESIEGAGVYVTLHSKGHEYLYRRTLNQLATSLDPEVFVRVHRSTIVNVNTIVFLEATSHGDFEARLLSGRHIQVSRTFRKLLEERLQQPL